MQRHPLELARRWHEQAREDLIDADRALRDGRYHVTCFFSQQGCEKALKGLLHWVKGDAPRVHLIETLLGELEVGDAGLEPELRLRAIALDKYYTTTRYPDVLDYALPSASFTRPEAMLALEAARDVIVHVAATLDAADHPDTTTE